MQSNEGTGVKTGLIIRYGTETVEYQDMTSGLVSCSSVTAGGVVVVGPGVVVGACAGLVVVVGGCRCLLLLFWSDERHISQRM